MAGRWGKSFGGKQAPPFAPKSQKMPGPKALPAPPAPKALPTNIGEVGKIPVGALTSAPYGPFGRKKKGTYNPNIMKSSYTQTP